MYQNCCQILTFYMEDFQYKNTGRTVLVCLFFFLPFFFSFSPLFLHPLSSRSSPHPTSNSKRSTESVVGFCCGLFWNEKKLLILHFLKQMIQTLLMCFSMFQFLCVCVCFSSKQNFITINTFLYNYYLFLTKTAFPDMKIFHHNFFLQYEL